MAEMLNHAIHRLMERTDQEVSRKEITNAIEGRHMQFAKKLTNSRSLVYLNTPSGIVKIVLHKPTGKVVTVLPWKDRYKFTTKFTSPMYGNLEAEIYPDCYQETNCKTALTKIIRIHPDGAREPIAFNHPVFEGAFNEVWKRFKEVDIDRKAQTETESGTCGSTCEFNPSQTETGSQEKSIRTI